MLALPIALALSQPFGLSDPEVAERLKSCAESVEDAADDAAVWECAGESELYESCSKQHGESDEALLACLGYRDPWTIPIEELRENIETQHPLNMTQLALREFYQGGSKQEGLFWFYVSQLRWQARLACHDFTPDSEPALFGAFFMPVRGEFHAWAARDFDEWLDTIDRALEWDEKTTQRFSEDVSCAKHAQRPRERLANFRNYLNENREEVQAQLSEEAQYIDEDAIGQ